MTSNHDGYNVRPDRSAASPSDSQPKPKSVSDAASSPITDGLPSRKQRKRLSPPRPTNAKPNTKSNADGSSASAAPRSRSSAPHSPKFSSSSSTRTTAGQRKPSNAQPQSRNGQGTGRFSIKATSKATSRSKIAAPVKPSPRYDDVPTEEMFEAKAPLYKRIPASLLGMRWLRSWPLVMLVLFGILGTAGTVAVVSLFRIPNLPNCRAIFWPTASASLRLQCAESYAAQGDVENLLAAIALVDKLPKNHPLRSDIINDRIEDWANLVLDLAELSFEEGDLEEAINSARKIPARTAAAAVVEERVSRWQRIWQDGENGFNTAVGKVKEKDFQAAFTLSVALLDVENRYWATEKYNELTKIISLAREDSRQLSEALGFAKEGTVKGYTEALKRLKEITEESVFYAEAQGERERIGNEMLEAGEELLANRQLSGAQAMLNAIPRDIGLDAELEDFQTFVTAYQQAWTGSVGGLENAINRISSIGRNRPSYNRAQRLAAQWQSEIQDVALLNQARERASRGSTADLRSAISLAGRISRESGQWDDASAQISEWQTRVETTQDRPILDRADQLAAVGTPDNLRAAIQEARKISSERALASEANRRIETWTGRIQRIEDQPLLDQARQRANIGDRAGAIAIASRRSEGRVLYDDAQAEISRWQAQENGRQRLGEAVNAANRGDANSLATAIDLASQVPANSDSRARADSQIDSWSWTLLRQAEVESGRNLETAITLAQRIPPQAEAYEPAQVRIRTWRENLREDEAAGRRAPLRTGDGVPANIQLTTPGE
ncbi:MAG: chromosome segregation ATPase [Cyanobacteria bacterium P01_F01_bin.3]